VHSGEVIVGNVGGATMFDYRALGDPVNTASRLEGANRHLGTRICVSETTVQGAPGVPVRPVGALVLRGRSQALQVYEPMSAADAHSRAPLEDYCAAYTLLERGDAQALPALQALLERHAQDPLLQLHTRRLLAGETGTLIHLDGK
jgi:adenylate cyclase